MYGRSQTIAWQSPCLRNPCARLAPVADSSFRASLEFSRCLETTGVQPTAESASDKKGANCKIFSVDKRVTIH